VSKTYAFTLRDGDTDLVEALASLPKRQRSGWIRDALRGHLAQSSKAPSLLHQVLNRLGAIEIKISNIGHAPPEPTEEIWDEEKDGVLLDLDF
jgi:hypothetical protein